MGGCVDVVVMVWVEEVKGVGSRTVEGVRGGSWVVVRGAGSGRDMRCTRDGGDRIVDHRPGWSKHRCRDRVGIAGGAAL